MIKKLLLVVVFFCVYNASALDFVVDGIKYNVTSGNNVEVVANTTKYSGSITIPKTVISNGVTYNVTTIGSFAFNDCFDLTSVSIPNSITIIGYSAFYTCLKLTSIDIPNSVTDIGAFSFSGCFALVSVSIASSVNWIGSGAFNTSSIKSIRCAVKTPVVINPNVFAGLDKSTCTLTVPVGSVAAYQNADVWKEFTTINSDATLSNISFESKNSALIYPNPFNNEFFLELGTADNAKIEVFENTGKILIQKSVNKIINSIDTSSLKTGIYFVKVNSDEGVVTKKVIKK